jgi:hypothetical protein
LPRQKRIEKFEGIYGGKYRNAEKMLDKSKKLGQTLIYPVATGT